MAAPDLSPLEAKILSLYAWQRDQSDDLKFCAIFDEPLEDCQTAIDRLAELDLIYVPGGTNDRVD